MTIVLAILLAFAFGYSLTMLPLLRSSLAGAIVLPLAFASDTFSIAVMEAVDNATMIVVPGAMDAAERCLTPKRCQTPVRATAAQIAERTGAGG